MKVIQENNIDIFKESISFYYIITQDGRVINKKTGNDTKFYPDQKGYPKARIYCKLSKHKDKRIPIRLHRLVALFHLKDFNFALEVNHKNGIKTDNNVNNLEMVTRSQNCKHSWHFLDKDKKRRASLIRNNKGQFIKRKKTINNENI